MTIIYVPRKEPHTEEITDIDRVIEICNTFNPYEQKQYKTFIFCSMSPSEDNLVRCYFKGILSRQSGVPLSKVLHAQPKVDEIYLSEIGHIELQ